MRRIPVAAQEPAAQPPGVDPDGEPLLRRLVRARDEERRRIERDLHDGAQQDVLAVMVGLELAAGLAADRPELAERLLGLRRQLDDALERIRDLARGVFPPLLDQEGLPAALEAMAARMDPAPTVSCRGVGRYPVEVEAAVFFGCVEAAQNAAKHAGPGAAISIDVADHRAGIAFELRDDGVGFDPRSAAPGQGLANIAERLAAVGGTLEVASGHGEGTVVAGFVPLAPT